MLDVRVIWASGQVDILVRVVFHVIQFAVAVWIINILPTSGANHFRVRITNPFDALALFKIKIKAASDYLRDNIFTEDSISWNVIISNVTDESS